MNRKLVSNALTGIDEELIAEAMQFRAAERSQIPERNTDMETWNPKRRRGASRRVITLALAACLLLALTVTAYALNLFGLRDLYANPNRGEMPQEAAEHITPQSAQVEGDGWSAQVLESYCDEETVLVTVCVNADARYLVVPTDEDPNSPVRVIGLEGEESLGDYARREGKTLLFVGAALDQETLGLTSDGQRFENSSPQEMTIYFEGARSGGLTGAIETTCRVVAVAWPPDAGEQDLDTSAVERYELPITLTEAGSTLLGEYVPADPYAVPGLELGELSLTQTPLGISLYLTGTPTDGYAEADLMTLRVDGLSFYGAGRLGLREDGSFFAEGSQGRGEVGDTITVTFLNWDKEPVGSTTYVKK